MIAKFRYACHTIPVASGDRGGSGFGRHGSQGHEPHRMTAAPGDTRRILWARALRAFGDGFAAILLPVHLAALGFDALAVGAIATATLLGSALLTLALGAVG